MACAVADRDTPAADFGTDAPACADFCFNHFFRDFRHHRGGVPLDDAKILAPTLRDLGWHLQLGPTKDLPDTTPA